MKKIILAIMVVALATTSFAKSNNSKSIMSGKSEVNTTEISGVVTDKISNEALVGAEVKIDGTDLKTYTDLDGKFAFKNLKKGKYKLVTSYISYEKKITNKLKAKAQNNVGIQLEASN